MSFRTREQCICTVHSVEKDTSQYHALTPDHFTGYAGFYGQPVHNHGDTKGMLGNAQVLRVAFSKTTKK